MSNRIQGTTRLIGLLGRPLAHSRSPHMHNSAFDNIKEDYVYMCFEIGKEDLKQAIESLKLFNAKGANITFPNKQEVIKYIDELSEDAKIIGSVNTIKIDTNTKKVIGYNTDGRGFISSIEELGINYKNNKVVVIGVGGAGRAIAIQLAYEKVKEIVIKDIDINIMQEVKQTITNNIPNCKVTLINTEAELEKELQDTVLLVNATPLGMKGNEDKCIISSPQILKNTKAFIYDIVYEPRETLLMKYAKQSGLQTSNGINMMIWQGALSFNIWLDKDMPQEYVRKELFEG